MVSLPLHTIRRVLFSRYFYIIIYGALGLVSSLYSLHFISLLSLLSSSFFFFFFFFFFQVGQTDQHSKLRSREKEGKKNGGRRRRRRRDVEEKKGEEESCSNASRFLQKFFKKEVLLLLFPCVKSNPPFTFKVLSCNKSCEHAWGLFFLFFSSSSSFFYLAFFFTFARLLIFFFCLQGEINSLSPSQSLAAAELWVSVSTCWKEPPGLLVVRHGHLYSIANAFEKTKMFSK